MKDKISKYKVDKSIFLCVILFAIISIISILSAQNLITDNSLVIKQIIWYVIGFILIYFIMFIGNQFLFKNACINLKTLSREILSLTIK